MAMKVEKQRIEREEEMALREQLLAKFAEDDRIEQMNMQKRRMKIQEHKREVAQGFMERSPGVRVPLPPYRHQRQIS